MPFSDYVIGWALFCVPLGAAALVATAVTRRCALDRPGRRVAWSLVGVAAYLSIHLVPLAVGMLSRVTVIAVAGAAVVAALALWRHTPEPASAPPPSRPEASPWWSWAVAGASALTVSAAAVALLRDRVNHVPEGIDTTTFHLPNVARWMETGSLWQIDQFIPLQAQGYYPNHGDLLLLASVLPWDNDFLVRLPVAVLLALLAAVVVAIGRELRAPAALGVSVAALLCATPIFAQATLRNAMPDVLVAFAMACAGFFLLRHARTGARSDLVLAGLALGLALGTKWYGMPAAAAVASLGLGMRFHSGVEPRRVIREGALLGAVAITYGGIWLVRNAVEVGNPFFPTGEEDVVRELVGFSIAHYLGDPGVLFGELPGEILEGLGLVGVVLGAGVVLAALVWIRTRTEMLGLALVLVAGALAALYMVTPYSALGFEGSPVEANFNTRYALPALLAGSAATLWATSRLGAGVVILQLAALAAILHALEDAYGPLRAAPLLAGLVAAAGGAAAVSWLANRGSRLLWAGAAATVALGVVGYEWRAQQRVNATRYAGSDAALSALADRDGAGEEHVAVAGDWNARGASPIWPSFGERIENRVSVVATFEGGFLTSPDDAGRFGRLLAAIDSDYLLVGRGLAPTPGRTPREQEWARGLGWNVVAASERLVLMAPG